MNAALRDAIARLEYVARDEEIPAGLAVGAKLAEDVAALLAALSTQPAEDIRALVDHLNGLMDSLDEYVWHDQIYDQLLLAWNMARDLSPQPSSPPADDVREALAKLLWLSSFEFSNPRREPITRWEDVQTSAGRQKARYQAGVILDAFAVRPYGTVTAEDREAELRELHHFEVEQQLAETIAIVKRAQAAVLRHEHTAASLRMDSILNEVNTEIPSGESVRPYGTVTDTAGDIRAWRPEDGDSRCQRCGARNPVWWAENKQWNATVGGPDATEDPGGILCPTCYHALWLRAADQPSDGGDRS